MASKLKIKHSAKVTANHFKIDMALAVRIMLEEAPETEDFSVVITSGEDSHDAGLHPVGLALDFRTWNISAETLEDRRNIAASWRDRAAVRLGDDYDVIFETHQHPGEDHIHIEYDPKES